MVRAEGGEPLEEKRTNLWAEQAACRRRGVWVEASLRGGGREGKGGEALGGGGPGRGRRASCRREARAPGLVRDGKTVESTGARPVSHRWAEPGPNVAAHTICPDLAC